MPELTIVDWVEWGKHPDSGDDAHVQVLHDYIVANRIKITGEAHQHSGAGVPLFSDGTVIEGSMRWWGGVMADAWNEIEETDKYDYMDFYMKGWGNGPE